ncbi:MAG: type I methionyl aminopeptidase [Caldilineae bacterium]|nr:MAG: type I methionyl aminopeptidase [Caldilineae bacterium]
MQPLLRDADEIAHMRAAGRVTARVHEAMRRHIRPGISTAELNAIAEDVIRSAGAVPTFLGYHGFPACICTSINDEIVHGIPNPGVILQEGDIISIDVGATLDGWVGDAAWTYAVGQIPASTQRLLEVTEAALWAGIEMARAGNRLGDISAAVQQTVEANGFSVIREFTGHGVGREMHEPPEVLNYGQPGTGLRLRPGMTLALEPMVSAGHWLTDTDADGWTVRTMDGSLSAHFEHTIAITTEAPLILTSP